MKERLCELLICPGCLPKEVSLTLDVRERLHDEVLDGFLRCPQCSNFYPVIEGVACLLPPTELASSSGPTKYETPETVSSYIWSHYAEFAGDAEASSAYREWASLIRPTDGLALDLGCAVGRFSFELSLKSAFTIGLDTSSGFIHTARRMLIHGGLEAELVEEGRITRSHAFRLPRTFDPERLEFIIGNAQAIPFPRDAFSIVASLNLVDKLPKPLTHLREIDRVAKVESAQMLLSDPFSWSEDIAREEDWLGGKPEGPFSGFGVDNIQRFLEGKSHEIHQAWSIEERRPIWWKIRNHRNHFELIRSLAVKGSR